MEWTRKGYVLTDDALWFEREIEAPRSAVCRAWTEPERLRDWYRPDDAWSTPIAEIDLRIGGAYRFGLKSSTAETAERHSITYRLPEVALCEP